MRCVMYNNNHIGRRGENAINSERVLVKNSDGQFLPAIRVTYLDPICNTIYIINYYIEEKFPNIGEELFIPD